MVARLSWQLAALTACIVACVVSLTGSGPAAVAQALDYADLRARAERSYAEGSYSRAYELYRQARDLELDAAERRWVAFRLGDSAWRAAAAADFDDQSAIEAARRQLADVIDAVRREQDRDSIWADAHESLGDSWWGEHDRDWAKAWEFYAPALDWWAASADLVTARERYLGMVWKIAGPLAERSYIGFGEAPPFRALDNAVVIADNDADRARAGLLLAMLLARSGQTRETQQRVTPAFEAALAASAHTPWRDEILYRFGVWMGDGGSEVRVGEGRWRYPSNPARSLELLRTLTAEYGKGETPHYDDAARRITELTRRYARVSSSHVFVPGSEIELQLEWRNVAAVDLKLYEIELPGSVDMSRFNTSPAGSWWLRAVDLHERQPLRSWSVSTGDAGDHQLGHRLIRIEGELPVGAYVLEATPAGDGRQGAIAIRELVLVSDASLVLKRAGDQALVYFCDAFSGAPLAGASVTLWTGRRVERKTTWTRHVSTTGDDGIAVFPSAGTGSAFAAAALHDRQAFSTSSGTGRRRSWGTWRIYAYTDRAAYRPGERARWKLTARRYDGSVYSTPAHETLWYEIHDPRGARVAAAQVELNAFGSAWGELLLGDAMVLGQYRVSFKHEEGGREIGSAALLRLEEYKLPEFKVLVDMPTQEDGSRKTFRPGETIEASIRAEYYSGGAMADATVEVVVYQKPFRQYWRPRREYAWYYDDIDRDFAGYGYGQVIERQTLTADSDGAVTVRFKPPPSSEQDFEYRIEAHVTDASRRQIVGSDIVRVTRQRAFVHARPRHHLVRPTDTVQVDFNAIDANQQPLQISGRVTVTRDTWQERGYEHEEIVSAPIHTDATGEAELAFTPGSDGYYTITFSGDDEGTAIVASTAVWAATNASTELGFRHGALGIIVDRDTFHVGETASVLLTTPDSDRYVLFSVAGDDLYSYQLVHVTGTAKLVQIELRDRHAPNIHVGGTMVAEGSIYEVRQQVVVPPDRNFLEVQVEADAEQHRPGEQGTLTVHVRDREGRPVAAEVGLALVDEATFYIQGEYAADPRQFFFGDKRPDVVATTSTFHARSYVDLVQTSEGALAPRDQLGRGMGERSGSPRTAWSYDAAEVTDMSALGAAPVFFDFDSFRERALGYVNDSATVVKYYNAPPPAAAAAGQYMQSLPAPAAEWAVQVRSDFRATAFWQPDVVTGADGTATVGVTYPDSLAGWRATARVASAANHFGVATTTTRTDKPLTVRLQAPRFFVVGDTATVSAVLNNNTGEAITATTALAADGVRILDAAGENASEAAPTLIPPGGDGRVDWTVRVTEPGAVRLVVTASGEGHDDAMERRFVAHEHGLEKLVAAAGKLQGDEVSARLSIPAERQPGSTRLEVQVTPSVAVTMLDALPYLIDYPYGCTEQTLSRFLPAVITTRTLGALGLTPEAVAERVFGGVEPAYRAGPGAAQDSHLQQLDDVVQRGLTLLYDFQHGDGGWGWWKGGDSDPFMTAYAVWGLALARDAGIAVDRRSLERAAHYLGLELIEQQDQPDLQAWMLHALAVYADVQRRKPEPPLRLAPEPARRAEEETARFERARSEAFANLWQRRDQLNAYARALFALSAHHLGSAEQAQVLVRNLENGVVRDERPDGSILRPVAGAAGSAPLPTAHWGRDGLWWRWSDGGVEATSFALRALLAIDPGNALIEPAATWLIKNRRGAQWSNTRDTAIAVLALNDYLAATGELRTDVEYELQVNGTSVVRRRVSGDDILRAPSRFVVDPELIADGANDVRIVRHAGDGPLYFAAQATYLSREEPIAAAGNEIFVHRQYNRLVGRKTLLKGYAYDRQPLQDGETVTSGERLEVVIRIDARNNYEYLMFEDLKPAGLETVAVRSGGSLTARELESGTSGAPASDEYTGRSRWVYEELRDRKVALFVDKLPQGLWEIRYQVRAEVPGEFHALPVIGRAMYVPEIRANGQEQRLPVIDEPQRR